MKEDIYNFSIKMNDCFNTAIDIAIKKAKTAAYTQISTKKLNKLYTKEILYGVENTNNGMIPFQEQNPL